MPAGNTTETLRSGARPWTPLDFGPTDPFGRLDCLLLPWLPILSDTLTCDCASSTRTDRRWSDRNDPLWGGDAPTKDLESFCAAASGGPVTQLRAGGLAPGFRAGKPWDGAPRPLSPFAPASSSRGARLPSRTYPQATRWDFARKPHGQTAPSGNPPLSQEPHFR